MRRALGLIGAGICGVSIALAVEPETVALEFEAPGACPDQAAFKSEVRARTELVRFVTHASSRRFRVSIHARESGFAGRLEIVDAAGERTLREIDGAECSDVISVLALDAALAIDPNASTAPRSELVPKPEAPMEAASSAPPLATPATAAPSSAPPPTVAMPLHSDYFPSETRFALGLGAHATGGPAPKLLIGPALFGEIETGSDPVVMPLLRIGVRAARTGTVGPSFDAARFSWLIGKLELCPIRLGLAKEAAIRPCGFVDLGVDRAEADSNVIDNARTASRFWAAAGVSAWFRLDLGDGPFLTAGGGLATPLTRHDFYFKRLNGDESVHNVPALAGHAEILAGYEFE